MGRIKRPADHKVSRSQLESRLRQAFDAWMKVLLPHSIEADVIQNLDKFEPLREILSKDSVSEIFVEKGMAKEFMDGLISTTDLDTLVCLLFSVSDMIDLSTGDLSAWFIENGLVEYLIKMLRRSDIGTSMSLLALAAAQQQQQGQQVIPLPAPIAIPPGATLVPSTSGASRDTSRLKAACICALSSLTGRESNFERVAQAMDRREIDLLNNILQLKSMMSLHSRCIIFINHLYVSSTFVDLISRQIIPSVMTLLMYNVTNHIKLVKKKLQDHMAKQQQQLQSAAQEIASMSGTSGSGSLAASAGNHASSVVISSPSPTESGSDKNAASTTATGTTPPASSTPTSSPTSTTTTSHDQVDKMYNDSLYVDFIASACLLLGNLTTNYDNCLVAEAYSVIDIMTLLFHNSNDHNTPEVIANVVKCLANLATIAPNRAKLRKSNILSMAIRLLLTPRLRLDLRAHLILLLANMAGSEGANAAIIDQSVIYALSCFLEDVTNPVPHDSVLIGIDDFLDFGYSPFQDENFQRYGCLLVANLATDPAAVPLLVETGCVKYLVRLCLTRGRYPDIQRQAVRGIHHIAAYARGEYVPVLEAEGASKALQSVIEDEVARAVVSTEPSAPAQSTVSTAVETSTSASSYSSSHKPDSSSSSASSTVLENPSTDDVKESPLASSPSADASTVKESSAQEEEEEEVPSKQSNDALADSTSAEGSANSSSSSTVPPASEAPTQTSDTPSTRQDGPAAPASFPAPFPLTPLETLAVSALAHIRAAGYHTGADKEGMTKSESSSLTSAAQAAANLALIQEQVDQEKTRGNEHFNSKRWNESIACYTRAIELAPNNVTLFSNRSAAYTQLGQFQAALQDAERCVELQRDWVKGHFRRGKALMGLHDYDEAIVSLKEALNCDKTSKEIQEALRSAVAKAKDMEFSRPVPHFYHLNASAILQLLKQLFSQRSVVHIPITMHTDPSKDPSGTSSSSTTFEVRSTHVAQLLVQLLDILKTYYDPGTSSDTQYRLVGQTPVEDIGLALHDWATKIHIPKLMTCPGIDFVLFHMDMAAPCARRLAKQHPDNETMWYNNQDLSCYQFGFFVTTILTRLVIEGHNHFGLGAMKRLIQLNSDRLVRLSIGTPLSQATMQVSGQGGFGLPKMPWLRPLFLSNTGIRCIAMDAFEAQMYEPHSLTLLNSLTTAEWLSLPQEELDAVVRWTVLPAFSEGEEGPLLQQVVEIWGSVFSIPGTRKNLPYYAEKFPDSDFINFIISQLPQANLPSSAIDPNILPVASPEARQLGMRWATTWLEGSA